MRDLKLDEYHDLAIENDDFQYVEGLDEIVQACRVALLTIKYEYWLDGNEGIPWNNGMFWVWTTQEEKELYVRQQLLAVEGVVSVERLLYSYDSENRSALIEVDINTTEGLITGIGV